MSAAKSKRQAEPEGNAGAEIVIPQPVPVDGPLAPPGPPAGFVEIEHPDIPGLAVIPEAAFETHRGRGWVLAGELAKIPEGSSGEPPTPSTEES